MICSCCMKLMTHQINIIKDQFCTNCGIEIPKNSLFLGCNKMKLNPKYKFAKIKCINCKVCTKGHNLRPVINLKALSQVESLYTTNQFNCDICKTVQIENKNKNVLHCLSCQFDVCERCQNKLKLDFIENLKGVLKKKNEM